MSRGSTRNGLRDAIIGLTIFAVIAGVGCGRKEPLGADSTAREWVRAVFAMLQDGAFEIEFAGEYVGPQPDLYDIDLQILGSVVVGEGDYAERPFRTQYKLETVRDDENDAFDSSTSLHALMIRRGNEVWMELNHDYLDEVQRIVLSGSYEDLMEADLGDTQSFMLDMSSGTALDVQVETFLESAGLETVGMAEGVVTLEGPMRLTDSEVDTALEEADLTLKVRIEAATYFPLGMSLQKDGEPFIEVTFRYERLEEPPEGARFKYQPHPGG